MQTIKQLASPLVSDAFSNQSQKTSEAFVISSSTFLALNSILSHRINWDMFLKNVQPVSRAWEKRVTIVPKKSHRLCDNTSCIYTSKIKSVIVYGVNSTLAFMSRILNTTNVFLPYPCP